MSLSIIRFRSDIQGLRAVAVGAVIAYHAGAPFLKGGFAGVDVFFVISGFLITQLMLRDREHDSSPRQLASFYARRARRIIPAATTVILATLALSVLLQNGLERVWRSQEAVASALFYANVYFVDQVGILPVDKPSPLAHYWSLAVEEQFYAVWPLLFFAICAVTSPRWRRVALGGFVVTLGVVSFVIAEMWLSRPTNGQLNAARAFCLLPPRAWQLGVGALLAICAPRLASAPLGARKAMQWIGLAAVATSLGLVSQSNEFPGVPALLPTLGAAAMIAAGLGTSPGGLVDRVLASRPLQLGGRYSYSMYLWHLPLYLLVVAPNVDGWGLRLVATSALTIAAAVVTYHLIEEPVRDAPALRLRGSARSVAVGAVCIVVTLLGAAVVSAQGKATMRRNVRNGVAQAVLPRPPVTLSAPRPSAEAIPADDFVSALTNAKTARYAGPRTTAPLPTTAPRIAVIGDSHAEHLLPGLDRAASVLGAHVESHTLRWCPAYASAESSLRVPCDAFKREVMAELLATPPDLIVLSTALVADVSASGETPERLRAFRAIAPLIVVSYTPTAAGDTPSCLAANLASIGECTKTWPTEANAVYEDVAAANGASFLDLQPVLCADESCPAVIDGEIVWSDREHLAPGFSATLGPWLAEQLRPQLLS